MSGLSYQNQLLIASPKMPDERFKKTVIYIGIHDERGALGFVLNKPTTARLSDICQKIGIELKHTQDLPIGWGGPVDSQLLFMLYKGEHRWGTRLIRNGDLGVTLSRDLIEALVEGQGPEKVGFFVGVAAWEARQLQEEIDSGDWLVAQPSEAVMFDLPCHDRWEVALSMVGLSAQQIEKLSAMTMSGCIGHA